MHCVSIYALIGIVALAQTRTEADQAGKPNPATASMTAARQQPSGATGESDYKAPIGGSALRELVTEHTPDPFHDRPRAITLLEEAKRGKNQAVIASLERFLERIDTIRRDRQVRLTLEAVIRTALSHSYAISVESHNPAIETTRVVEAEAAFDALFFIDVVKRIEDKPSASELSSTDLDFFQLSTGIRKLLPTGMQVSGTYLMQRTKTALSFQQLNPAYFNSLELSLRQPLLRGFGIDYNRSVIRVAKNNRRLSDLAFFRMVQDTVHQVETLYWRLVQARREVVIATRTLADFERIYDWLVARRDFDVMEVQLQATKANLEQSRAEFIVTHAAVADAVDALIAAINDPNLNLAEDIEIIPEDFPFLDPLSIDRLAEVQTALEQRPEIPLAESAAAASLDQLDIQRSGVAPAKGLGLVLAECLKDVPVLIAVHQETEPLEIRDRRLEIADARCLQPIRQRFVVGLRRRQKLDSGAGEVFGRLGNVDDLERHVLYARPAIVVYVDLYLRLVEARPERFVVRHLDAALLVPHHDGLQSAADARPNVVGVELHVPIALEAHDVFEERDDRHERSHVGSEVIDALETDRVSVGVEGGGLLHAGHQAVGLVGVLDETEFHWNPAVHRCEQPM